MKKYLKLGLYGALTWIIPFVVGFFFYTREGVLTIDPVFFKSIMIAVSSIFSAILLTLYFKKITTNYLSESMMVGIVWLLINILMDIIVLIPMSKMGYSSYFGNIALSYLMIPAMCIAAGAIAENAIRSNSHKVG